MNTKENYKGCNQHNYKKNKKSTGIYLVWSQDMQNPYFHIKTYLNARLQLSSV